MRSEYELLPQGLLNDWLSPLERREWRALGILLLSEAANPDYRENAKGFNNS